MERITDNKITIWKINATRDPEKINHCLGILSAYELTQAKNILHESQRNLYIISHAASRQILANYLHIPLSEIHIDLHDNGKPFLRNSNGVHFNLSHTHNVALFGLSNNKSIGLDVEFINSGRNILGIAKRFFSPSEYKWLRQSPHQEQLKIFYQLWCYKEACLKGVGCGLKGGLDHFSINDSQIQAGGNTLVHDSIWHFQPIKVSSEHVAAIAHKQDPFKYVLSYWD